MSKTLIALTPEAVEERVRQGHALLIDIREDDEFARRHIPGALSRPLSRFEAVALPEMAGTEIIFTCRSGMHRCQCRSAGKPGRRQRLCA